MCARSRASSFCALQVLSWILLGKFQSDSLESRFGWYRQLSGANYFISPKQLLESERKIKALSLIKFSHISPADIQVVNDDNGASPDLSEPLLSRVIQAESDLPPVTKSDCCAIYFVTGAVIRSEMF